MLPGNALQLVKGVPNLIDWDLSAPFGSSQCLEGGARYLYKDRIAIRCIQGRLRQSCGLLSTLDDVLNASTISFLSRYLHPIHGEELESFLCVCM
jgi:hypothetical protein